MSGESMYEVIIGFCLLIGAIALYLLPALISSRRGLSTAGAGGKIKAAIPLHRGLMLCLVWAAGATPVLADEQMRPLAASGDWLAMAHSESMTDPPDVCIVANVRSNVLFRASEANGIEFRVINKNWSLPADVQGQIVLSIGSQTETLDIGNNTDNLVSAPVSNDMIIPIFSAMDNASSMQVTVGHDKPFIVSLAGSTKATNAFRTCAGIKSNAPLPGSNPFQ